jgi:hypothetical protein
VSTPISGPISRTREFALGHLFDALKQAFRLVDDLSEVA